MPRTTVKAEYTRHHKESAMGHIFIDKKGACVIELAGAASMTQAELDFYGEIMAKAISKVKLEQIESFGRKSIIL